MFRMTREAFNSLVELIGPTIGRSSRRNSEREREAGDQTKKISVEVKIAIFVRMMAGGSYHDLGLLYGVAECTVYKIFSDCLSSAQDVLDWAVLPELSNIDALKKRSLAFTWSRPHLNPLPGCVGAVDGIHIKIEKPRRPCGPRMFFSRKGYFSIPVQAVVDASYRFIAGSAICKGSTHDSVAPRLSHIGRYLDEGKLPKGFWFSGDDAYSALYPEQLITPFRRALASRYELAFNFFQSSHRVHVEQAFGLLMKKWGILWSPLKFKLSTVSSIVSAAMLLHNFCIDNDGGVEKRDPRLEEKMCAWQELEKWLEWCRGDRADHADSIMGYAVDSIPGQENMHGEKRSFARAMLVRLLRLKGKLQSELILRSWMHIMHEEGAQTEEESDCASLVDAESDDEDESDESDTEDLDGETAALLKDLAGVQAAVVSNN